MVYAISQWNSLLHIKHFPGIIVDINLEPIFDFCKTAFRIELSLTI